MVLALTALESHAQSPGACRPMLLAINLALPPRSSLLLEPIGDNVPVAVSIVQGLRVTMRPEDDASGSDVVTVSAKSHCMPCDATDFAAVVLFHGQSDSQAKTTPLGMSRT